MKANPIPQLNNEQKGKFISKIEFSKGCWNWIGGKERGYGTLNTHGKRYAAHRVSFQLFRNEVIPLDMTIDHVCRNKICVNPFHLEVVSVSENVKRASPFFFNNFKTHCKNGHPFSEENTYRRAGRYPDRIVRHCMECRRRTLREFRRREKLSRPMMS
jgi:hypothetical protein